MVVEVGTVLRIEFRVESNVMISYGCQSVLFFLAIAGVLFGTCYHNLGLEVCFFDPFDGPLQLRV